MSILPKNYLRAYAETNFLILEVILTILGVLLRRKLQRSRIESSSLSDHVLML